ncbi:MAG: substrate-binding domain-containing protein [Betaproteobacteria bacterium]|nr:substrate-binding domain-containing protein [Betaproteobacteria bacterium]
MTSGKTAAVSTLRVLSAGAVKGGVAQLVAEFERATGVRVTVVFEPAPEVRKRIAAGETADVIVLPQAMMDDLAHEGKIVADSRAHLGRSRMGVVVHKNAPTPDLSSAAALKRAVLGANAVVYNKASSGLYAAKLMQKLGLAKELGSRTVIVDSGAAIMEYVAAQPPGAVGLAQISEIMVLIDKGCAVQLAAPLPDEIQNVTSYDAAATAGSKSQDAARALARELTSDAAKKIFAATGIA